MMGLDTSETCRGWRNILRISCASSSFFFTRSYRDAARSTERRCYHYFLRNNPKVSSCQVPCGGSLKTRFLKFTKAWQIFCTKVLYELLSAFQAKFLNIYRKKQTFPAKCASLLIAQGETILTSIVDIHFSVNITCAGSA